MRLKTGLLLCAGLGLGSCSDGNLPKYYQLGSLRILGIQSSASEVDPSGGAVPVIITPIISDVNHGGRTLTYAASACLDPGVGLGADPDCDHDPTKQTFGAPITTLSAPAYTDEANTFTVSVPPTVFAGRTDHEKHNGVPFLVVYTVTSSDGESTSAIKRLIATTRTPLNTAPAITAILKDGAALTAPPSVKSEITPTITGSAEAYDVKLADGTLSRRQEQLTVTWFTTGGEFVYTRTDSSSPNTFTPPATVPNVFFLAALVRDDRGSVSFWMVGP